MRGARAGTARRRPGRDKPHHVFPPGRPTTGPSAGTTTWPASSSSPAAVLSHPRARTSPCHRRGASAERARGGPRQRAERKLARGRRRGPRGEQRARVVRPAGRPARARREGGWMTTDGSGRWRRRRAGGARAAERDVRARWVRLLYLRRSMRCWSWDWDRTGPGRSPSRQWNSIVAGRSSPRALRLQSYILSLLVGQRCQAGAVYYLTPSETRTRAAEPYVRCSIVTVQYVLS